MQSPSAGTGQGRQGRLAHRELLGSLPCFCLWEDGLMFSIRQKRDIAEKVQRILRETNHPELPEDEIQFCLHVDGAEAWSWADIRNNGAVAAPGVNPWNEIQDMGES